jgi:hypothetical protein
LAFERVNAFHRTKNSSLGHASGVDFFHGMRNFGVFGRQLRSGRVAWFIP